MITDKLMTLEDVAEYLQVHTRTLWLLRRAGDFAAPIRVGSSLRWRRRDVESWAEAQVK